MLDGDPNTGQTYAHLVKGVLPIGLRGLVAAALLASLMSTVSGALNSIAALVGTILWKRCAATPGPTWVTSGCSPWCWQWSWSISIGSLPERNKPFHDTFVSRS